MALAKLFSARSGVNPEVLKIPVDIIYPYRLVEGVGITELAK
jgi:hypothetical protein